MKIVYGNDIIIYISKQYVEKNNLNEGKNIKKFINILKNKYNLELYGYYEIKIYIDKNYGIIMKLIKNELEYLDYLNNELEININIIEDSFLYQIEDLWLLKKIKDNIVIYKCFEKIYIEINKISNIFLPSIIENSTIIFGEQAVKIKDKSLIINPEVIK